MADLSLLEQRKLEARVLVPVIQAFEKEFGKERTHEIVRRVVADIARKSGEEFGKVSEGQPLDKVRAIVPVFSRDDALEMEVVRDSETSYDFDVVRCRFAEFYHEMGVPELGVLLSCSRDFALTEGVSPDLELRRTQTIMEGRATATSASARRRQGKGERKHRARRTAGRAEPPARVTG